MPPCAASPKSCTRGSESFSSRKKKTPASAWPKPPLRIASNAHPPKDHETGPGQPSSAGVAHCHFAGQRLSASDGPCVRISVESVRNRGKSVEARIWSHNRNKRPARVVCDVQTVSISAARGIAIREKSAVRPFSIESHFQSNLTPLIAWGSRK